MPLDELAADVETMAGKVGADLLLVFDEGGVTGHPDHCRATEAALAGAPGLPVLAWTLPRRVADSLNAELGTTFIGRADEEVDVVLRTDRAGQHRGHRVPHQPERRQSGAEATPRVARQRRVAAVAA